MNTWLIGWFSRKIKLSLSQKRLFVSWICWCCNYAFFLSRMLHLRAFLSRMSWLRAFWRRILRRIFGRNSQKYAEFWQKFCGKNWPLEPLPLTLVKESWRQIKLTRHDNSASLDFTTCLPSGWRLRITSLATATLWANSWTFSLGKNVGFSKRIFAFGNGLSVKGGRGGGG